MKIFEIFVNTKTFEEFKYTINSIGNPNNLDIDKEYMLYGEKTCVNIHKGYISNLDRCEDDMGCGIISYEEWMKCDPFIKYGIAYGNEGIEHALNTQHLLLDHITNMYLENEGNITNLFKKINNHFNIKYK